MLTGVLLVVQKAGEDGIGTGFRTYGQDPRQERQGPSLPSPQQRPVEGWREDSQGARWQGSPAEVSNAHAIVTSCRCCKNLSVSSKLCRLDRVPGLVWLTAMPLYLVPRKEFIKGLACSVCEREG